MCVCVCVTVCVRLPVCEARRIVNGFDESVAQIAQFYDSDVDSDEGATMTAAADQAEARQLEVAQELYDEYIAIASRALLDAPILSELRFCAYEQVLFLPCREVSRNDLSFWGRRRIFFVEEVEELIIPALAEALARM